jgi:hypothetical protein
MGFFQKMDLIDCQPHYGFVCKKNGFARTKSAVTPQKSGAPRPRLSRPGAMDPASKKCILLIIIHITALFEKNRCNV